MQRLGKFDEAERLERRGLAMREEVFGADGMLTTYSLNNLANIVQRLGAIRRPPSCCSACWTSG